MLDVRALRRSGLRFDVPGSGSCTWVDGSHATIEVAPPRLTVTFQVWEGYSRGYVAVPRELQTTTTPCHYGRSRTWLLSPACGRRCLALAISHQGHALACRICSGLSYETQSMTRRARIERRLQQLQERLERGRRSRSWGA